MPNRFTRKAQNVLNRAQESARELGHTYIGSEHLLLGLSGEPDSISRKLLNVCGGEYEKFRKTVIDWSGIGVPTILSGRDMTPKVKNIIEVSANESAKSGQGYIGTEHLLSALLAETDCMALRIMSASGVSLSELRKEVRSFLDSLPGKSSSKEKANEKTKHQIPGAPTLSSFGRNLTEQASEGKLDPIIGRERETMRVMQILSRRTKNNPCLIGEPGVGKTAVVEGLAQRIVDDKVPDNLRDKIIVTLDVPSMIAGAKYRGEFEDRMKNIMEEVRRNDNIILFIDEIHTIIGAGAAEGAVDAANIIKPALARSELQVIGATTIAEFRKHIEKDAALERRFQPVMVGEPSAEQTMTILRGLRDKYESHHGLNISDEALDAAVSLSVRYINDRFLPDKAIDLIDEAASRRKIESYTAPPELSATREKLIGIASEKEEAIIAQDFEEAARLRNEEISLQEEFEAEKQDWDSKHSEARITVTAEDIGKTVTEWTGIPVGRANENENEKILSLNEKLSKRVIGQENAISKVVSAIKRGRSGLKDPHRPCGVFLFCGRTGIGKTELAVSLADEMYGKNNLVRLDMSEYMEKHSVSKLIGSPPGYVGYDEGGRLTEAVRRHPYSVVLFDEIEKAHPDVFNILLQIFDDGKLTDSQGRSADFRNTVIIMTSNIGFGNYEKANSLGFGGSSTEEQNKKEQSRVLTSIRQTLRPEFLNRLDEIIVFEPLTEESINKISRSILESITNRAYSLNFNVDFSDQAVKFISSKGFSEQYGARNLKRTITTLVEDSLSELILEGGIHPGDTVFIDLDGEKIIPRVMSEKN